MGNCPCTQIFLLQDWVHSIWYLGRANHWNISTSGSKQLLKVHTGSSNNQATAVRVGGLFSHVWGLVPVRTPWRTWGQRNNGPPAVIPPSTLANTIPGPLQTQRRSLDLWMLLFSLLRHRQIRETVLVHVSWGGFYWQRHLGRCSLLFNGAQDRNILTPFCCWPWFSASDSWDLAALLWPWGEPA